MKRVQAFKSVILGYKNIT